MGVEVKKRGGAWVLIAEDGGEHVEQAFATRKDADRAAALVRASLKQTAPKIPFNRYAETWLREYVKPVLKSQTYRGYESIVRVHLIPRFGNMELSAITRGHIKAFIAEKRAEEIRPGVCRAASRVKRIKSCLSGIFSYAVDDDLIKNNPAAGLDKLLRDRKQGRRIPDVYTEEELEFYLETIRAAFPREYPLFLTLARTGMRLGEALGLKWKDLDFSIHRTVIIRTLTEKKVVEPPKSGKYHGADMSDGLEEALKAHRKAMISEFGKAPEWVFVNRSGNPMDRGNLTRRVHNPAISRAGLHRIRIHDIRHSLATIRMNRGHDLNDIALQLGHSSSRFTMEVYGHFKPGRCRDQINELDRLGKPSRPDTGDKAGG